MQRSIFQKGKQKLFVKLVREQSGFSFAELGKMFDVCPRSFSDWLNEKYSISHDLVKKLSKLIKIKIPGGIKIVPRYWYAVKAGKQGGKKYAEIYGSPGTVEGRMLGGRQSIIAHKKFKTKFVRCKKVSLPKKTADLAEFFGIILGDGGISKYQLIITLNRHSDYKYYLEVKKIIKKLFDTECSVINKNNCVLIMMNSVHVIDFLLRNKLKIGNKVVNQIDVPEWVKRTNNFSRSCIRGLIDTDGCIYFERHKYKGKLYKNICLNFSNRSMPLLKFVSTFLNRHDIKAKLNQYSVKVGRIEDVKKYFKLIGSSNQKHTDKYNLHINSIIK